MIQEGLHTTVSDFEQELRDQLLLKKLTDALAANLYVSEDEIQRAYRDQVERAKIRYVELPRARFAQQVTAAPAEVAAYYQAHQQEFKLPEQRDVAYLLVNSTSASPLAGQAQVTDQDLHSYYDAHKGEYAQEEQIRARHILVMVNDQRNDAAAAARVQEAKKKLAGGEDFAKVAPEYSDDTASKAKGGDLGAFGRNRMVKEFEDAAFSAPIGKVVGPVKSNFGYHLIEVTAKQPGGQQPFEAVKEPIRARLTAERTRQLAESRAKELATRLAAQQARQRRRPEGPRRPDPRRHLRPRPRSAPPIRSPASAPPSTPPPSRSRRARSRRRSRCRRGGPSSTSTTSSRRTPPSSRRSRTG